MVWNFAHKGATTKRLSPFNSFSVWWAVCSSSKLYCGLCKILIWISSWPDTKPLSGLFTYFNHLSHMARHLNFFLKVFIDSCFFILHFVNCPCAFVIGVFARFISSNFCIICFCFDGRIDIPTTSPKWWLWSSCMTWAVCLETKSLIIISLHIANCKTIFKL